MGRSSLKILVVDDEIEIARSTSDYLSRVGFEPIPTYTAEEAFIEFQNHKPSVCILDIHLPGMSGIDLLKNIMKEEVDTQIIMLTGYGSMENVTEALRAGACDFLQKPINFEILLHSVNKCFDKVDLLRMKEEYKNNLEKEVADKTHQIRAGLYATIRTLGRITRVRDPYTQGHEERVVNLSKAIATKMDYTLEKLQGMEIAAVLHDVGKIAIPAQILVKPSKPTKKERALLEEHVTYSFKIIKDIPFIDIIGMDIAEIVYQHHERIDGKGYPRGLEEEDILDEAKILAVADMVESMSSHRPYRAAIPMNRVLDVIKDQRGVELDVDCVDACLKVLEENDFDIEKIV